MPKRFDSSSHNRVGRFDGRLAVVTGAAGEIGRATTTKLARLGATVLAVDKNPSAVETFDHGDDEFGTIVPHHGDVTDPLSVREYADVAARLGGGRIDFFFNNAGIEGIPASIVDTELDVFDAVYAVNVRGVFLGLKYVLPWMGEGGVVVNAGSTASLRGTAGVAAYSSSKHAVLGLSRTAAIEAAHTGVRVCTVCPGPIESRMMATLAGARDTSASNPGLLGDGRFGTTNEVANAVCFLFSDDASFMTGNTLVIDGGRIG